MQAGAITQIIGPHEKMNVFTRDFKNSKNRTATFRIKGPIIIPLHIAQGERGASLYGELSTLQILICDTWVSHDMLVGRG